ncbi:MAG: rod shape-determining protein MreC [Bacteroidota bacterium]|nr:rod shape-determining protein MreC [Bacteroidota bacterium]
MGSILLFFVRYHKILLFLLLELTSLSLVIRYNNNQSLAFMEFSTVVSGSVNGWVSSVNHYFHLRSANDSLLAENVRLREGMALSRFADTSKSYIVTDTTLKQRYTYLPSHVVKNSVYERNNYLTLDIGSNHDITPHMGVISSSGIVGITRNVLPNFTYVISILHKDFKVSAEIIEINEIGSVEIWDGHSPDRVLLRGIPVHARVKVGQKVVTSPYSGTFPQGTMIGVIEKFEVSPGSSNYTIYVKLSTNMRNIRYAYVVRDLMKTQQDSVEVKLPE